MNNRSFLNVDDTEIELMVAAFWRAMELSTYGGADQHAQSKFAMRAAVTALEESGSFSAETLSGRLRTAIRKAAPNPVTIDDLTIALIGAKYTKARKDVLNSIVSGFAREKDARVVRVAKGTYVWRERE